MVGYLFEVAKTHQLILFCLLVIAGFTVRVTYSRCLCRLGDEDYSGSQWFWSLISLVTAFLIAAALAITLFATFSV